MLISIAFCLAHELGLHNRRVEDLDTPRALERDRVFWVAYILDRDTSLRTNQPPVQHEVDIDIEWPLAEPEDGAGTVTDVNGQHPFNFLRCRVHLARIQGEVYDFMAATRAGTLDEYLSDENITHLNDMLDDWLSSIPPPFRPSSIAQTGQPNLCRSFAVPFSMHLACRTQLCRADAMASRWIQSLRSFGRTTTRQGQRVAAPVPTPSYRDWEKLVDESRGVYAAVWGGRAERSGIHLVRPPSSVINLSIEADLGRS